MSIKVMSLVWEHYPAGGGELLTALAYADHAHDDGSGIRPSVAHVSKKTRQSERTIQMHLATMRQATWLLTVRYAAGGRGRATEYRVNPQWISNPAEFAPFFHRTETVQRDTPKGASDDAKGCKAFAPQPCRTVKEPTTTSETREGEGDSPGVVVEHDELCFPEALSGEARLSADTLIASCPNNWRQAVLDEIGGLADRGAVRHPLGLLRSLVERAKAGGFVPAAAIDYRRKLDRLRLEKERRAFECCRRPKTEPLLRVVPTQN
jgi:hypothetical protein